MLKGLLLGMTGGVFTRVYTHTHPWILYYTTGTRRYYYMYNYIDSMYSTVNDTPSFAEQGGDVASQQQDGRVGKIQ